MNEERLRLDVWLWRARFVKTRSDAARLVAEGGVRLMRGGMSRALDKPATPVAPGDVLGFPLRGELKLVRIEALGARRGPAAEARALYCDLEAEPNADIGGLA
ncbi:MAG TPA: S4 domain-containing protein [Caulobacterales bacterium]|nr:S4 domain-containing protein [Caulobacterales bacterium]